MNMDKIEKIRQFVKELQQDFISIQPKDCSLELIKSYAGYAYLDKVLSFLDTLSEEPDKSLEEAARRYAIPTYMKDVDENFLDEYPYDPVAEKAFKAGVEWKESQMLKDAVEGEICGRVYDHINVRFADGVCKHLEPKNISHIPADVSKYNIGDKVRIVVLKAEEEKK